MYNVQVIINSLRGILLNFQVASLLIDIFINFDLLMISS